MSIDWQALAAPFSDEDLEWRGHGKPTSNGKLLVLPYVTNRAIQQRLDDVVGPDKWSNAFHVGPQGGVLCTITLLTDSGPISKTDGADNTDIEAIKGGLSDAMKRAAVQWGIGRYLYSLPKYFIAKDDTGKCWYKGFGKFSPPKLGGVPAAPRAEPTADASDRVAKCLKYFAKNGIFERELEENLQKKSTEWTDEDIDTLKKAYGI
jgi:hypothetical protein